MDIRKSVGSSHGDSSSDELDIFENEDSRPLEDLSGSTGPVQRFNHAIRVPSYFGNEFMIGEAFVSSRLRQMASKLTTGEQFHLRRWPTDILRLIHEDKLPRGSNLWNSELLEATCPILQYYDTNNPWIGLMLSAVIRSTFVLAGRVPNYTFLTSQGIDLLNNSVFICPHDQCPTFSSSEEFIIDHANASHNSPLTAPAQTWTVRVLGTSICQNITLTRLSDESHHDCAQRLLDALYYHVQRSSPDGANRQILRLSPIACVFLCKGCSVSNIQCADTVVFDRFDVYDANQVIA